MPIETRVLTQAEIDELTRGAERLRDRRIAHLRMEDYPRPLPDAPSVDEARLILGYAVLISVSLGLILGMALESWMTAYIAEVVK